jgi:putative hydrolase of the HAD superfamily
MKRALILDLDNTIYPVNSIADKLFKELFDLIDNDLGEQDKQAANKAKEELTRRPYQQVADEFGFSEELKSKGTELLRNLTYDEPMQAYKEYEDIRSIDIDKYLVTNGFTKLQLSKVDALNIRNDFKNVYVVDPDESDKTKGDIFKKIMSENGYSTEEVLVIGDDLQSEIKFAKELGIDTFLFDPEDKLNNGETTYKAKDYRDISSIIL